MNSRFKTKYGPWAVVTGASDGIGREFARALAKAGFNLVLVARRRARLEELAAELSARYEIEIRAVDVDLSHKDAPQTVLEATAPLDVGLLVAAAGFGTSGAFLDAPLDAELEMIDVNCRAVVALSFGFGQRFKARGRGGLVLMSSLLAFQGVPRAANYAATKAFVQTLAEGLRLEMAPLGIHVVACAPGPIHSGFAERARMQMGFAQKPQSVALATLNALGRRGTVRPGWLSKTLEASLAPLPRLARSRIMARVMAGMTKGRAVPVRGENATGLESR